MKTIRLILLTAWSILIAAIAQGADVKISALPDATALTGTEQAPVVQSATTVKATADQFKTYTLSGYAGATSITTLGTIATGTWNGTLIGSGFGGTGNAFFAVSGPATSTKTFTFPNASATVLTSNAAVTVPQGGTGLTSLTQGDIVYASASNTLSALAKNTTATRYLANTGTSNNPAWSQINLANGVTGNLSVSNLNSGTSASSSTFWRGDGTWATPSSSVSFPLTAPNGNVAAASYSFTTDTSSGMFYSTANGGPQVQGNNVYIKAGSGKVTLEASNTIQIVAPPSGQALTIGNATGSTTGLGSINVAGGYFVNGVPISSGGASAYGAFLASGGLCSTDLSYASSNMSSCFGTTGNYSISFSPGTFSSPPVCTATLFDRGLGAPYSIMVSGPGSSSSITVVVRDASGTNQDSNFTLNCKG